jgi:diguanylate cyclase (GGDEF)-like protein
VRKVWHRLFEPVTDEVRLELVGALFQTGTPIALGGLTLVLVLLHSTIVANEFFIGALAIASILVTISRLLLNAEFLKVRSEAVENTPTAAWELRYAIGCFVFSALIGTAGALAFQTDNSGQQLLATALVFGYAAGAVCRISIRPAICVPAVVLAVLPTAVSSMARLEADHIFYGLFLTVFVLGSVETIRFLYRINVEQISLKHDFAELARHDALTGLANRLGFKERLKRAAARAHSNGDMIAVHSIDLDRFKEANDKYGHPVGDALLQAVAGRLNGVLRDDDFAVRLGGDEFVVVQVAMGHSQEAIILARRFIAALNQPFAIDGHELKIGASIGIAIGREFGRPRDPNVGGRQGALCIKGKRTQPGDFCAFGRSTNASNRLKNLKCAIYRS